LSPNYKYNPISSNATSNPLPPPKSKFDKLRRPGEETPTTFLGDWDNYLLTNDTSTRGRYEDKIEQMVNSNLEWIKEEGKMIILPISWKKD